MELVLLLSTCDPSSFFGWVVRVNETYFGNTHMKGVSAQPRMVPRSVRHCEGVIGVSRGVVDRITSQ